MKTFYDVEKFLNQGTNEQLYYQLKKQIVGLAVPWPNQFLMNEKNM